MADLPLKPQRARSPPTAFQPTPNDSLHAPLNNPFGSAAPPPPVIPTRETVPSASTIPSRDSSMVSPSMGASLSPGTTPSVAPLPPPVVPNLPPSTISAPRSPNMLPANASSSLSPGSFAGTMSNTQDYFGSPGGDDKSWRALCERQRRQIDMERGSWAVERDLLNREIADLQTQLMVAQTKLKRSEIDSEDPRRARERSGSASNNTLAAVSNNIARALSPSRAVSSSIRCSPAKVASKDGVGTSAAPSTTSQLPGISEHAPLSLGAGAEIYPSGPRYSSIDSTVRYPTAGPVASSGGSFGPWAVASPPKQQQPWNAISGDLGMPRAPRSSVATGAGMLGAKGVGASSSGGAMSPLTLTLPNKPESEAAPPSPPDSAASKPPLSPYPPANIKDAGHTPRKTGSRSPETSPLRQRANEGSAQKDHRAPRDPEQETPRPSTAERGHNDPVTDANTALNAALAPADVEEEDPELKGPLVLPVDPLAGPSLSLEALNKKLRETSGSRERSTPTVMLGRSPTLTATTVESDAEGGGAAAAATDMTDEKDKGSGKDQDDDNDDDTGVVAPLDAGPRLKLKSSMNFGAPMGQLGAFDARKPSV